MATDQEQNAADSRQIPLRVQFARSVPHMAGNTYGAGPRMPEYLLSVEIVATRMHQGHIGQIHQQQRQTVVCGEFSASSETGTGRPFRTLSRGGNLLGGLFARPSRGHR